MSRRLRVLIVEDEFLIASYIADLVEDVGHEVTASVTTGKEALVHLARGGLDLALLDIKLKGEINGIEVALAARSCSIPHVFVSGSGDPATRCAAEATSPVAFLQKPVDQARLWKILGTLVSGKVEP